jgi:hypothetical protein
VLLVLALPQIRMLLVPELSRKVPTYQMLEQQAMVLLLEFVWSQSLVYVSPIQSLVFL